MLSVLVPGGEPQWRCSVFTLIINLTRATLPVRSQSESGTTSTICRRSGWTHIKTSVCDDNHNHCALTPPPLFLSAQQLEMVEPSGWIHISLLSQVQNLSCCLFLLWFIENSSTCCKTPQHWQTALIRDIWWWKWRLHFQTSHFFFSFFFKSMWTAMVAFSGMLLSHGFSYLHNL